MKPSAAPLSNWTEADWELMWAPYPDELYTEALSHLQPDDVVLDIGAGDMRLVSQMARKVRHVYAIEIRPAMIKYARKKDLHLLPNLTILHADARTYPFPSGITTAVLLMRHCTHFHLYAEKLKFAGCKKLITNARWRTGIEVIDLQVPRRFIGDIPLGWYACWCGNTGFKPGAVEEIDEETVNTVYEVANCPNCSSP